MSFAPSLIDLRSFTGCETWRAFSEKGKKRAFALLKEMYHCQAMTDLGNTFYVTRSICLQLAQPAKAYWCQWGELWNLLFQRVQYIPTDTLLWCITAPCQARKLSNCCMEVSTLWTFSTTKFSWPWIDCWFLCCWTRSYYKQQVDQTTLHLTASPTTDLLFLQDRLQVQPVLLHKQLFEVHWCLQLCMQLWQSWRRWLYE